MTAKHSEQLKTAAMKAGLIDFDALVLADLSKDDGTVRGADELIIALKKAKPHLFRQKMAKDMSEPEREAFWRELRRKPPPEPMPTDKNARDMTAQERAEWLAEHKRRFG